GHLGEVQPFRGFWISSIKKSLISDTCVQVSFSPQMNTHEYNQTFGPAQIALSEEEYGWLTRFLDLREELLGVPTATFFFTSTPNCCKNLNSYFQAAWAEIPMGLNFRRFMCDVSEYSSFLSTG
ncbi:MAG: hypothetical protein ACRC9V_06615, partial [Aeromonas sp.]